MEVAIRNCYNQVVVGDEHQRAKPEAVPEEGQNIEILLEVGVGHSTSLSRPPFTRLQFRGYGHQQGNNSNTIHLTK